jgi:hypothetical protein
MIKLPGTWVQENEIRSNPVFREKLNRLIP